MQESDPMIRACVIIVVSSLWISISFAQSSVGGPKKNQNYVGGPIAQQNPVVARRRGEAMKTGQSASRIQKR
jgi:hypothetical protein